MTIGILKTDNVHPQLMSEFGEYPAMFAQLLNSVDDKLTFVTYDVIQMEYPQDLNEVDAYLITGSKYSVYEDLNWIRRLGAFVQELHQAQKKLIGICFGHQLIAHFLGGKTSASSRGWGIGIQKAQFNADGQAVTASDKKNYALLGIHQDQVLIPAPGSKILASSDFCPIAMYSIGQHILCVQGHPEFSPDYLRALLKLREHLFDKKHYQAALDSLTSENRDHLLVAQWIVNFLKN